MSKSKVGKGKVVFVYESHSDQSAVLVLQKLLLSLKGQGNIILCLEGAHNGMYQGIQKKASVLMGNVKVIKDVLESGDRNKIENCFRYLVDTGCIAVTSNSITGKEVIDGLSHYVSAIDEEYTCLNETLELIDIANQSNIKVYGIDLPLNQLQRSTDQFCMDQRDNYMHNQLVALSEESQDSVILYLVGLGHAGVAQTLKTRGVPVEEYFPHQLSTESHPEFPGIPESCMGVVVDVDQNGNLNESQIDSFASTIAKKLTAPSTGSEVLNIASQSVEQEGKDAESPAGASGSVAVNIDNNSSQDGQPNADSSSSTPNPIWKVLAGVVTFAVVAGALYLAGEGSQPADAAHE